jgi:hypothetical protein
LASFSALFFLLNSSKMVSLRCLISSTLPTRRATRKNYTKSRKTAGGLHPRPGQSGTRGGDVPLSPRCFIGYNLKSEPVTERFRYSLPSSHVTGTFYPFAVHRGCPGVRVVLAVRFPLSGESYVVYATASNSPRSHARSSRFTSGTPCRRETISKYGQDSRLLAKLLRTASQFLNLVPTIYQKDPGAAAKQATQQN